MNEEFKDYLFEYRFEDALWGITIKARSADEAHQRVSALTWAQYRGEIFATVHVPGGGIILKFLNWLRG